MRQLTITIITLLITGGFMISCAKEEQKIISHETENEFNLSAYQERLRSSSNLALPLEQELEILKQLTEFEFGKFLLARKGLNGYWTAYMIIHGPQKQSKHPLEEWLLSQSPSIKATQERFKIFQHQLEKYTKDNMIIASIPCGLMDDLLSANYHNARNISLAGIDLDEESLIFAQENVAKHNLPYKTSFVKKNAWELNIDSKLDIITSNGLNIYESDDNKVIELYKEFFKALRPGGILITSFLTPPPALSKDSTWRNYSPDDALKQKAIFSDILQVKWQIFRTEAQVHRQLTEAGFKVLEVIYDTQGIFPTIVAQRVK